MSSFGERLLELVNATPGLTDRELTDQLRGKEAHPSQVNQESRHLERLGHLIRQLRLDGLIGNFPASPERAAETPPKRPPIVKTEEGLSEDELKQHLDQWLTSDGWETTVAWGKTRGVDIHAVRNEVDWIIEVKGLGSLPAMRVNYFISMLGETLQRMAGANARYSIALPDIAQYRGLWHRLPALAKERTQITALFVAADGTVSADPPECDTLQPTSRHS